MASRKKLQEHMSEMDLRMGKQWGCNQTALVLTLTPILNTLKMASIPIDTIEFTSDKTCIGLSVSLIKQ